MSNNSKPVADDDLDDLDDLDDYLDEFQDEILNKPYEEIEKEAKERAGKVTVNTASIANDIKEAETNQQENVEDELAGQLENVLKELQHDSPQAKEQFESLLKNLSSIDQTQPTSTPAPETKQQRAPRPGDFKDTISSTLNRLKESGAKVDQSIKEEQPDQLLADLIKQLNLDGEGGLGGDDLGNFDISNLLVDLLDQLASKSVLYEPLKDLSVKYPKYIHENKDKITPEELERYTKQSEIVQVIVAKFEDPEYSDSSKEHKEFISQKLEEMQTSGNPPDDLLGDLSKTGLPGFQFDNDDIPEDLDGDIQKDLEENCKQT